ncbi:AAA family ATPase [Adlercreutzia sp. ZJ242]|uniref:AAA family ATPase n=1 Tax=Adlercreutzia sp. ZJ242 TaxID=2709409 RepID=UPI0013EB2A3D|nr:AAA family ATPase [Adlercreutzia sp. ZJ242]
MQLKSVALENFKALKDIDIEFGKFTVLTGLNSVGKTTLFQSLALMKQSIERNEVTFNDYLLRMGDYKEIVYAHDASLEMRIAPRFEDEAYGESTYEARIRERGIQESFIEGDRHVWRWDSTAPGVIEPYHRVFLSQVAKGYGGGEYLVHDRAEITKAVEGQKLVYDWFTNMLYLSSNRGFTKYSYPLLAGAPTIEDVSKRAGDHSLLEEWLSNLIMYKINEAKRYPGVRNQLEVMQDRLSKIGVNINPYVMGGPSVVMDLDEGGMWVSAVNSGYGVNQSIAAIVLGTLYQPGTLIMIEEPEMHLHPVMQRRIAEILVDIANEGKQVAITCHSDHILRRLNQMVGEGVIAADDVKLYNFKRSETKATFAEEISISDRDTLEAFFEG